MNNLKIPRRVKAHEQDEGQVISNLDAWVTRPMRGQELGHAWEAIPGSNDLDHLKTQIQKAAAIQPRHGSILQGLAKRAGKTYLLDEVNLMILGWGIGGW